MAGLCGLILNTITFILAATGMFNGHSVTPLTGGAFVPLVLSIAWSRLEPRAKRHLPADYRWATVFVDVGLLIGFLAVLVASPIIQQDLWRLGGSNFMFMTYNNVPWMVCA